MAPKAAAVNIKPTAKAFKDKSKPTDVRLSNIQAAKGEKARKLTKLSTFVYQNVGVCAIY